MDEVKRNSLVGVFVLGGLIALGTLIVKFGESSWLFRRGYLVTARFDQVPSLREGTEVRLAGVLVGRVQMIDLVDRADPTAGVKVVLEIEKEYVISKDSTASVAPPLIGQPVVNIEPKPKSVEPLPTDGTAVIQGKVRNVLEDVIDPELMDSVTTTTEQIRRLAEALTPAARAFANLLEERTISDVEEARLQGKELTANLYTAVQRLHNVLMHVETVLGDGDVQSGLREIVANFRTASEDFKAGMVDLQQFAKDAQATASDARNVMGKIDDTVVSTRGHIDTLGDKLAANLDKMSELLDELNKASRYATEGQGTIAMLLKDPQFYESLLLTTQRLGEAAAELKALIKKWQTEGLGLFR